MNDANHIELVIMKLIMFFLYCPSLYHLYVLQHNPHQSARTFHYLDETELRYL